MHGQAAAGEIVATSKFKPSKASSTAAKQRQQEADVVDDWDAESNDDDSKAGTQSADVFKKSNDQWTEALGYLDRCFRRDRPAPRGRVEEG
ncbi:hypothetical protein PHSY_006624 [Pseudozyma hubeiensis SY62]|uniref:Uncharacterized protein n=1 Tax=Pseudozyma hubeiensis (strain SY62) TaxID=1305764 RepID=R9PCQ7_PSEHS|nr:hypothetical protein PHSY_006624 [Pseudozyma hubeiensis SY62]GAC99027.1 hypothetical protein PHSY_006624 [Pseudozyma hubeiensis SY62]